MEGLGFRWAHLEKEKKTKEENGQQFHELSQNMQLPLGS